MNAKQFKDRSYHKLGTFDKGKEDADQRRRESKRSTKDLWDGIKKAWDIYTQDNIIVKDAKKNLDSAIDRIIQIIFA